MECFKPFEKFTRNFYFKLYRQLFLASASIWTNITGYSSVILYCEYLISHFFTFKIELYCTSSEIELTPFATAHMKYNFYIKRAGVANI